MKLNIQLDESVSEKFDLIKEHYQVKNYTEVIRLMISTTHRSINQGIDQYEVPATQKNKIVELLKRGDMVENNIYTVQDFVKHAVDSAINDLKPLSIIDRKARYELQGDEQKIANAMVLVFTENESRDCQVHEIRKTLGWEAKDDKLIEETLDRFVTRKLILKQSQDGKTYYFAS